MIKHYFNLLSFIALFFSSTLLSAVTCSPELKNHVETIERLPEARVLIAAVQKQGEFTIIANHTPLARQFGAYWDCDRREINIGLGPNRSYGSVIGSILFELQNALVESKWDHLDSLAMRKRIDRNTYIREAEYVEYLNSLSCAKMADKGIQMGLYPKEARLHTYKDFDEHFYYQNISGHSQVFGRNYDCLSRT